MMLSLWLCYWIGIILLKIAADSKKCIRGGIFLLNVLFFLDMWLFSK